MSDLKNIKSVNECKMIPKEAFKTSDFKNLKDAELINLITLGNYEPFNVLYLKHCDRLLVNASMSLKDVNKAKDVVQNTFLKAFDFILNNPDKAKEKSNFKALINMMYKNVLIDELRPNFEQKNTRNFSELKGDDDSKEYEENTISKDLGEFKELFEGSKEARLKKLIDRLPDEQREVINLKYFRDFKFEEIATFQDISINTALGRSRYALQNLRNFMIV